MFLESFDIRYSYKQVTSHLNCELWKSELFQQCNVLCFYRYFWKILLSLSKKQHCYASLLISQSLILHLFVVDSTSECKSEDERKKRPRTAFTAAQIKSLEAEFERNKYLSVAKRCQLSKSLKLTETQVNIFVK